MKNGKILTDIELRAHWYRTQEKCYTVAPGTYVTPAAQDFIREHQIQLHFAAPVSKKTMSVTPIPVQNGKARFVDYSTGAALDGKPEEVFTQVETMRQLSLDVPASTELLWQLNQAGLSLPLDALDMESCAQVIASVLK